MKGLFQPYTTLHSPYIIAIPKYLSSLCHEDGSRLSSLWQSFCHYLTEQSSIASVGIKHSFRWLKA